VAGEKPFRQQLPLIAASATATVLATVCGSFLGPKGTLAGMGIGTAFTGTATWWIERWYRLAAAKAAMVRRRGRPLTPKEETQLMKVARRRNWWMYAGVAAGGLLTTAALVTVVEVAAGKPVSAIVKGQPGSGVTLGGGSDTPSSPPARKHRHHRHWRVTPSASPVSTSPTAVIPAVSSTPAAPTPSESVSPSPSPSGPAPSVSSSPAVSAPAATP
jgi:hypothetical protein